MKTLALAAAVILGVSWAAALAQQHDSEVVLKSGTTMIFQRDVAITLRDGHLVYANVYRPREGGRYPVILAQTIYGKDPNFRDGYKARFEELKQEVPELCERSSCNLIKWEVTDPERWLPEKYAVMIVDVRGSGKSPGLLDSLGPRETSDFYDVIEWAGTQSWSNGKVGLLGKLVPGDEPVAGDRTATAPSGGDHSMGRRLRLVSRRLVPWRDSQQSFCRPMEQQPSVSQRARQRQDALPRSGNRGTDHRATAARVLCRRQRCRKTGAAARRRGLQAAHADLFTHQVAAVVRRQLGWNGPAWRGNIEGYLQAGSTHKWLRIHTGSHHGEFYNDVGFALQKRFFDHYLKGIENG
jgi:uncharacterized protein